MKTLVLFIGIFLTQSVIGQNSKEVLFIKTIKSVILTLSNRDSIGLSNYINTENGTWLLYKTGIKETYLFRKTIGFTDKTFPNFPFFDNVKFSPIKFEVLPKFDCGRQKFNKTGIFVDTNKIDRLLSLTASENGDTARDKQLPMQIIENIGRKIVVADNKGHELIFYLSYYRSKWWLSIIDKLTCDCSS